MAPTQLLLARWLQSFLGLVALVLAIAPSILKLYETSRWFQSGDPSVKDATEEWLDNPSLPYEGLFQDPTTLTRVYMFIFPYGLSGVALFLMHLIAPPSTDLAIRKGRAPVFARSILRLTIPFPKWIVRLGAPYRVSLGECLGVCIFLVINLGTGVARINRSLPRGSTKLSFLVDDDEDISKQPIATFSWQACEVWAKTLGVLALVNVGWYLLMPMGRRSILLEALGVSWEKAVKYHRWVGYYTVVIIVLHGSGYVAVWLRGNGDERWDPDGVMVRHTLVPWGCRECNEDQHFLHSTSMYGMVCMLLVTIMAFFSLPWFRRNKFEWFYYSHHLFIVLLVFLVFHYPGAIVYLIPGVAVYGVDKMMALYAYQSSTQAKTCMKSSKVLEVQIDLATGVKYRPGQYIFLNVPEVSFLEWHPFSLTSAPGEGSGADRKIVLHIKNTGTWTEQVLARVALLLSEGKGGDLRVRVNGFYGQESGLEQHKDGVILVGGGIGITPMMSTALGLLRETTLRNVNLFWVVSTIEEFRIFSKELGLYLHRYGVQQDRFNVKVWLTLSGQGPALLASDGMGNKDSFDEFLQFVNGEVDDPGVASVCQSVMEGLDQHERDARVISALHYATRSENLQKLNSKKHDLASNTACPRPSGYNPVGLSNTSRLNIFIQVFAIFMMLNSWAFTSWIVVKHETSFSQPVEKSMVLHMSVLVATMVVVAGLAVAFHRLVPVIQDRICSGHQNEIDHSAPEQNTAHTDETSHGDLDVAEEEKLLPVMLEGNIGRRPDFQCEFLKVASMTGPAATTTLHATAPPTIGVIACGPVAMVQSINHICNSGSNLRGGPIFAFTDDDWEW